LLAPLLEILEDPQFHQVVSAMPGYEVRMMGKIIAQPG